MPWTFKILIRPGLQYRYSCRAKNSYEAWKKFWDFYYPRYHDDYQCIYSDRVGQYYILMYSLSENIKEVLDEVRVVNRAGRPSLTWYGR